MPQFIILKFYNARYKILKASKQRKQKQKTRNNKKVISQR